MGSALLWNSLEICCCVCVMGMGGAVCMEDDLGRLGVGEMVCGRSKPPRGRRLLRETQNLLLQCPSSALYWQSLS